MVDLPQLRSRPCQQLPLNHSAARPPESLSARWIVSAISSPSAVPKMRDAEAAISPNCQPRFEVTEVYLARSIKQGIGWADLPPGPQRAR